jgi:peptidyl-prolyl cis-trans isomerase D
MLQNMRDGAGKWLVWVIIIIVILTLSLWGISNYFLNGNASNTPAAKVNGTVITQDQVNMSLRRLQAQQPQLFTGDVDQNALKASLLNNLIHQQVLALAAESEGFVVSNTLRDSVITQLPAFQVNGKFSQAQFLQVLNQLMYTPAQFITEIESMLKINQVENGFVMSAFALPNEVTRISTLLNEQRNFSYMVIPVSRFTHSAKVQATQIEQYYSEHQEQYKTPEQVSVSYIELTPQSLSSTIQMSDSDLQNYYENNLSNYSTPARWQVAHILLLIPQNATPEQLQKLKEKLATIRHEASTGTAFAQLAKQYSQDQLTAKKSGELPWFTAGTFGSAFEQTVLKLKPNEVSEPVQTQYGYELIKLLAIQPQTTKPFKQVSGQVREAYKNQQMQKLIADKTDALANLAFENPTTLAPIAKQFKLPILTTSLFDRTGLAGGIAADKKLVASAFSDTVLLQGNNSDVLTLKDGSLVVLRINQHISPAVKPLSSVTASIQAILQQQQAVSLASEFGHELVLQISNNETARTLAAKNKLNWVSKAGVVRTDKTVPAEILSHAFKLFVPLRANTFATKGFVMANGDYAIIGLDKVITGKVSDSLGAQTQALASAIMQSQYENYSATQKNKAKIKLYLTE